LTAEWPGLHPQARALLLAATDEGDPPSLEADRAAYLDTTLQLGGAAEPVAGVEDVLVPRGEERIPAGLYLPQHEADTDTLIVWLHGGGWYVGDIPTFDRVARSLANAAGAKVMMLDYRLAPEHCFPAQTHDAIAAVAWARGEAGAQRLGIDPARVIVGGDSAGGQLAAVAVRAARTDGLPAPAAQLLVYPALDPRMESASYAEYADGPMLTREDMEQCWARYLDGREPGESAVLEAGDHAGLPPTWIAVAGHDPLRDDGLRYAEVLRAAGVPVQQRVFDDMVHGFLRWGGVADRARELLDWLGDAARATVS